MLGVSIGLSEGVADGPFDGLADGSEAPLGEGTLPPGSFVPTGASVLTGAAATGAGVTA